MNTIAFFDVDGTLLDGYSGYFATKALVQHKLVKTRRILAALFYRAMAPLYKGDVRKMYELILKDLVGYPIEELLAIGKECFDESICPRFYREGLTKLDEHRQQGHKIYLLSSGPYMVLEHIGKFLKVDGTKSINYMVSGGVIQNAIQEPLCYQEGKLVLAQQIAKRESADLSECYYYADNDDDLSLLLRVGYPRPVNPDKVLRRVALQNKWPIQQFNHCLGQEG
jgi:putative phosphoserine phosphatase / 1-acylglycerol-3-phosphate O-acyltransferase